MESRAKIRRVGSVDGFGSRSIRLRHGDEDRAGAQGARRRRVPDGLSTASRFLGEWAAGTVPEWAAGTMALRGTVPIGFCVISIDKSLILSRCRATSIVENAKLGTVSLRIDKCGA